MPQAFTKIIIKTKKAARVPGTALKSRLSKAFTCL